MGIAEDTNAALRRKMVAAIRIRLGLNERIATPIAEEVLEALREHFAAQCIYIPAAPKDLRNSAIRAKFNGRNIKEICREYGISRPHVYRIVAAGRRNTE